MRGRNGEGRKKDVEPLGDQYHRVPERLVSVLNSEIEETYQLPLN